MMWFYSMSCFSWCTFVGCFSFCVFSLSFSFASVFLNSRESVTHSHICTSSGENLENEARHYHSSVYIWCVSGTDCPSHRLLKTFVGNVRKLRVRRRKYQTNIADSCVRETFLLPLFFPTFLEGLMDGTWRAVSAWHYRRALHGNMSTLYRRPAL